MTFKKSHSLFSTPSPKVAEARSMLSHLSFRLNAPNFLSLLLQPHGCPGCLCQTSYSLLVLSTVESQTGHSIYSHSLTELTGGNCHFSTLMTTVVWLRPSKRSSYSTTQAHHSRMPPSFQAKLPSGLSCYMRSVQPIWRTLALPFAEPKMGSVKSFFQPVKVPWILCPALQHTDCFPSLKTC